MQLLYALSLQIIPALTFVLITLLFFLYSYNELGRSLRIVLIILFVLTGLCVFYPAIQKTVVGMFSAPNDTKFALTYALSQMAGLIKQICLNIILLILIAIKIISLKDQQKIIERPANE